MIFQNVAIYVPFPSSLNAIEFYSFSLPFISIYQRLDYKQSCWKKQNKGKNPKLKQAHKKNKIIVADYVVKIRNCHKKSNCTTKSLQNQGLLKIWQGQFIKRNWTLKSLELFLWPLSCANEKLSTKSNESTESSDNRSPLLWNCFYFAGTILTNKFMIKKIIYILNWISSSI